MTASRFAFFLAAFCACVDSEPLIDTEPAFLLQWENTMRAADFTAGDVFGFSVALENPDVRRLEFRTRPAVPEPATLALLGIGAAFAARRRARR